MNKHEWAARQQEKPRLPPKEEDHEEATEAEDPATDTAAASKSAAPLAPDG